MAGVGYLWQEMATCGRSPPENPGHGLVFGQLSLQLIFHPGSVQVLVPAFCFPRGQICVRLLACLSFVLQVFLLLLEMC